jgi:hypothetical protein
LNGMVHHDLSTCFGLLCLVDFWRGKGEDVGATTTRAEDDLYPDTGSAVWDRECGITIIICYQILVM